MTVALNNMQRVLIRRRRRRRANHGPRCYDLKRLGPASRPIESLGRLPDVARWCAITALSTASQSKSSSSSSLAVAAACGIAYHDTK